MDGKYKVTLNTPMGVEVGVLELKTNANNVSGRITSNKLNTSFSNGRVVGNNITFSGRIKMALMITIDYTANCIIRNGNISGVVQTKYGNFNVKGKKI